MSTAAGGYLHARRHVCYLREPSRSHALSLTRAPNTNREGVRKSSTKWFYIFHICIYNENLTSSYNLFTGLFTNKTERRLFYSYSEWHGCLHFNITRDIIIFTPWLDKSAFEYYYKWYKKYTSKSDRNMHVCHRWDTKFSPNIELTCRLR